MIAQSTPLWASYDTFDKNLFEVPDYEVHKTRVLKTIKGGALVYQAEP